jgi:hypothetical protein
VGISWEVSSRSTTGTGFLDLPRELRDMVYEEICSELKREGIRWTETDFRPESRVFLSTTTIRPLQFSDCAIMRTCRQLHAEFAKSMYAIPLQLRLSDSPLPKKTSPSGYIRELKGIHMLPFSPLYTPLVRSVLVLQRLEKDDLDTAWPSSLQIANALTRSFPNLDTQRVGWWDRHFNGEESWVYPGLEDWETVVRRAEKYIKLMRKLMDPPSNIPHNMELVVIAFLESRSLLPGYKGDTVMIGSPLAEAARTLRATKREKSKTSEKLHVW